MSSANQQTGPNTPSALSPFSPQFGTNYHNSDGTLPFDTQGRTLYLDGSPIAREPNETAYVIELHEASHHIIAPR
jgi:hypothetical protein